MDVVTDALDTDAAVPCLCTTRPFLKMFLKGTTLRFALAGSAMARGDAHDISMASLGERMVMRRLCIDWDMWWHSFTPAIPPPTTTTFFSAPLYGVEPQHPIVLVW